MRPQPQTVALGDLAWTIRPLTLAQVQAIEPILFAAGGAGTTVAAAVSILRIALERDHPAAAGGLESVEAGAGEIAAAMAAVLRLGGFLPHQTSSDETSSGGMASGGIASGEAGAGQPPA